MRLWIEIKSEHESQVRLKKRLKAGRRSKKKKVNFKTGRRILVTRTACLQKSLFLLLSTGCREQFSARFWQLKTGKRNEWISYRIVKNDSFILYINALFFFNKRLKALVRISSSFRLQKPRNQGGKRKHVRRRWQACLRPTLELLETEAIFLRTTTIFATLEIVKTKSRRENSNSWQ